MVTFILRIEPRLPVRRNLVGKGVAIPERRQRRRLQQGRDVAQECGEGLGRLGVEIDEDEPGMLVQGDRHQAEFFRVQAGKARSEEHTSELQSLMRNSYAVFCWKKK